MKKLLIIIGILFFSTSIFADFRLEVDNEKVDINENFQLKINIENEGKKGDGRIEIGGIDDFQVLGQSHQSSFKNINGKTTSSEVLVLNLKPIEKGEFTLGPVKMISGEEISSNKIKIFVDGEKIFLGNNGVRIENNSDENSGKNLEKSLENNLEIEKINFEENNFLFQILSFLVLILGLFFFFKKEIIKKFFYKNK